jgi:hypothetical protein
MMDNDPELGFELADPVKEGPPAGRGRGERFGAGLPGAVSSRMYGDRSSMNLGKEDFEHRPDGEAQQRGGRRPTPRLTAGRPRPGSSKTYEEIIFARRPAKPLPEEPQDQALGSDRRRPSSRWDHKRAREVPPAPKTPEFPPPDWGTRRQRPGAGPFRKPGRDGRRPGSPSPAIPSTGRRRSSIGRIPSHAQGEDVVRRDPHLTRPFEPPTARCIFAPRRRSPKGATPSCCGSGTSSHVAELPATCQDLEFTIEDGPPSTFIQNAQRQAATGFAAVRIGLGHGRNEGPHHRGRRPSARVLSRSSYDPASSAPSSIPAKKGAAVTAGRPPRQGASPPAPRPPSGPHRLHTARERREDGHRRTPPVCPWTAKKLSPEGHAPGMNASRWNPARLSRRDDLCRRR